MEKKDFFAIRSISPLYARQEEAEWWQQNFPKFIYVEMHTWTQYNHLIPGINRHWRKAYTNLCIRIKASNIHVAIEIVSHNLCAAFPIQLVFAPY